VISISGDLSLSMTMVGKENQRGNGGNGKIKGHVFESDNQGGRTLQGDAIEGVVIYLIDNATGEIVNSAVTDAEGFFEMEGISSGTYKLHIEVVGIEIEGTDSIIIFDESDGDLEIIAEVGNKESR